MEVRSKSFLGYPAMEMHPPWVHVRERRLRYLLFADFGPFLFPPPKVFTPGNLASCPLFVHGLGAVLAGKIKSRFPRSAARFAMRSIEL